MRKLKEYYPCNEKGPLCPILDDHNFLAEVFASDKYAWRGIKKYCKGKFADRLSFSLTRSEIGPLLKEIFNDPGLRSNYEAACHKRAKQAMVLLHRAIWQWATQDVALLRLVEKAQVSRGDKTYLNPQKFPDVLRAVESDDADPALALRCFWCVLAFAMLQKNDADAIFSMLGANNRFVKLLEPLKEETPAVDVETSAPLETFVGEGIQAEFSRRLDEAKELVSEIDRDLRGLVERVR